MNGGVAVWSDRFARPVNIPAAFIARLIERVATSRWAGSYTGSHVPSGYCRMPGPVSGGAVQ
jgi:hypothetical protein